MSTIVLEHLQHANSASPDLTVDSSGRIGIGTPTPSATLEINPASGGSELKITSTDNGGNNVRLIQGYNTYLNASNNVYMTAGGSTDMFNLVNGRVGIGTGSPQQELDVQTGQISVRAEQASAGGTGDAGAVNNLIHLRMPYGVNAGAVSNAGARVGIKFTGRNDDNGWGSDDGKSAAIYGVSEDALGYNRQMGMAFYTSPFDGAQVERMRIDNNGRVTTPYQPAFHAKPALVSGGNFSGGVFITSYQASVPLNNGNHWNNSTGIFTAPVAGQYVFHAQCRFDNFSGSYIYYDIRVNDSGRQARVLTSMGFSYFTYPMSCVVQLQANDTVRLWINVVGDSSVNIDSDADFYGYLLG